MRWATVAGTKTRTTESSPLYKSTLRATRKPKFPPEREAVFWSRSAERALAEDPESGVVIVADKASQTGEVVRVMDQCRLAGAQSVSLAARREVTD